jgi:membrane protein DedA with SNARE-associated domain
MDDIHQFIATYGYLAVLIGTFFEGETLLLIAGFMTWQAHGDASPALQMPLVIILATLGATAGDQLYFYLGRYRREWVFRRFPKLQTKALKVYGWVERHPHLIIIGSRFVYGFRIVTPIVLGTSRVPAWQYSILNVLGACLWALLVTNAGYFLGGMMERLLGDLHKIQKYLALGILLIGIGLLLFHRFRARRNATHD